MTILSYDEKNLKVFEAFVIDNALPKHTHLSDSETRDINNGVEHNMNTSVFTGGSIFNNGTSTYTGVSANTLYITGSSTITDLSQTDHVSHPKALVDQGVTSDDLVITLSEFFGHVRNNCGFRNVLSNMRYRRRVKALEALIDQCRSTGQISLNDLTMAELDRLKLEYILASKGFKEYVDEHNLVAALKHMNNVDQDLIELEWLANFNRIVPKKIIRRKDRADKLHVFDNYLILHIRPGWYGEEIERVSKAEADRRKDPIMFGVMNCSRRLYYIGDWVDTQCNLTLAELIDVMGDSGLDVNEIWSRTNPDIPFEGVGYLPPKTKEV